MNNTASQIIVVLFALLWGATLAMWWICARKLMRREWLVQYEPRNPAPWDGWHLLVVVWLYMLSGVVVRAAVNQLFSVDFAAGLENDVRQYSLLLAADSVMKLLGMILAIIFIMRVTGADWIDLGFDTRFIRWDVVLGIGTFVTTWPVVFALLNLVNHWVEYHHPMTDKIMQGSDTRLLILASWTAVVVAPVVEEFFCRVLLQGWLEARERRILILLRLRWLPRGVLPIMLTSLLFAFLHYGHGLAPIPLFVLALFLGYLYRQTHRIWPSIALHMSLNGLSMFQIWVKVLCGGSGE